MGPGGGPPKVHFLVSKMAFSRFPGSGLCRGLGASPDPRAPAHHSPPVVGPSHSDRMFEFSLVSVTHGILWAGCKRLEEVAAEAVSEAAFPGFPGSGLCRGSGGLATFEWCKTLF